MSAGDNAVSNAGLTLIEVRLDQKICVDSAKLTVCQCGDDIPKDGEQFPKFIPATNQIGIQNQELCVEMKGQRQF